MELEPLLNSDAGGGFIPVLRAARIIRLLIHLAAAATAVGRRKTTTVSEVK